MMNSPSKTGSRIYVPTQTFSVKWRCTPDDLKIGTQGATADGTSILGHTYGSSTSSTPSVMRGSERRDLPDTPTPLLLSVWTRTILQHSFAKQWQRWSNKVWGGRRHKCLEEGGEDATPAPRAHHGGNPLIKMSNPLFIPFLILHDIHVN
jgi:hypothetical protein